MSLWIVEVEPVALWANATEEALTNGKILSIAEAT
jgi:hypothetical protein